MDNAPENRNSLEAKFYLLGESPVARGCIVYYGPPVKEEDKFYPAFKNMVEYKIETRTQNEDGSFKIKLVGYDFEFLNVWLCK